MKKIRLALALASSLIVFSHSALALQQFDVKDNQTIIVKMSTRDLNRIEIQGGRIRLIKGADSSLVVSDKDDATGQALIKPLVNHPFSLIVFSEDEAFTLLVQPDDIPAETIVLKESAANVSAKAGLIEKAGNYEKSIKLMLRTMVGGEVNDGITVRKTWEEIPLWQSTRFALEKVYTGDTLTGETYVLFNLSSKPIRIAEQEFYKKGVIAIAEKSLEIAPGASTRIYIIERNGEDQ
jgi:conjugal transfer pilus assembly protein TraK